MKNASYLLVDASSLPDVYGKVLQVKQLLANREASSTSEAVRMVGISRSVFYKYKDAVFPYNKKQSSQILTIQAVLLDRPGVLMALMAVFYDVGANILTINQNIPVDGRALISVSARTESMELPVENLLEKLRNVEGVLSIQSIRDE
ncbi:MAG TPA: ACT domain-containing protein [Firmicutes bacterium]|nr:ACT domain-containing protein [Bacillota bacterium]